MKQRYPLLFIVFLFVFSNTAFASDPLIIDRQLPSNIQLNFPNPNQIVPQRSDFEIINAIPMSSDSGERWVLLTIRNLVNGNRTINQQQLMAIMANGDRVFPAKFSQIFKSEETLSVTIYFSNSDFPIVQVISNTNS